MVVVVVGVGFTRGGLSFLVDGRRMGGASDSTSRVQRFAGTKDKNNVYLTQILAKTTLQPLVYSSVLL